MTAHALAAPASFGALWHRQLRRASTTSRIMAQAVQVADRGREYDKRWAEIWQGGLQAGQVGQKLQQRELTRTCSVRLCAEAVQPFFAVK